MLPRTSYKMLTGYRGQEEDLLKNLWMMKAKNDTAAKPKDGEAGSIGSDESCFTA